jgi:hypothetical protein
MLYVAVVIAILSVYYFVHFKLNSSDIGKHEDAMDIQLYTDILAAVSFISFPFAGPLHRALGYFDDDPLLLQERLALLTNDTGTSLAITLAFACCVAYTIGEFLFFGHAIPEFIWQVAYVPVVFLNIVIFYGNILLAILTMRVFLVRLYCIEEKVKEALLKTDPMPGTYNTFASNTTTVANGNHDYHRGEDEERAELSQQSPQTSEGTSLRPMEWVSEWTQQYRVLRQHVHDVSHYFGFRMVSALFIFTLDATTLIAVVWEDLGPELGVKAVTAMLLSFCSNAFMITGAFYCAAYIVVECSHHIGPKLAILAVRLHSECPQLQVLASAFLHAPAKIHVGVFEVAPEYASAVGMWFLGLFLVVFGLKIPGEV